MPALGHLRRLQRAAAPGLSLTLIILLAVTGCEEPREDEPPCPDEIGRICTWAGTGRAGFDGDGKPPRESTLYWPMDVGFGPEGVYLADWNNHRVRHVGADGLLQTVVGTDSAGDGDHEQRDRFDNEGARGTSVGLTLPTDVLFIGHDGLMAIASWHGHKVRTFNPKTGQAFVFAGSEPGFAGDGGPVRASLLSRPSRLAVDPEGNVYILDQRNQRVRRVTKVTGIIETVVGNGRKGFAGDGGPALQAELAFADGPNPEPHGGLAIDSQGNLYIADTLNERIRRVERATGTITTVAGTGETGYSGDGGPALEATFRSPRDIALDGDGRLLVADTDNHVVRMIDLEAGTISTVAGNGSRGFSGDGEAATSAELARPHGVAISPDGVLYVSDTFNHRVRRVRLR